MTIDRRMFLGGALTAATAAALTGCGPGTAGGAGDGTGRIRFSIWFGEGDIPVWKEVIAGFQKVHPDITVAFEPLEYGAYWTKLNTQLAGGNAPDVIGMQFQSAALGPAGQLAPLQDAVAEDIGSIPENLAVVGQAEADGAVQQYALPWRFVGASLYANLTAMEEAGISRPEEWTIDDLLAAAKELTSGKSFGMTVPEGGAGVALSSTFGAAPVSADGRTATFDSEAMTAYKTWLRDLIHVHKVAQKPTDVSDQRDPFATDQVRLTFQGSWVTPTYRAIEDFDWDILPNPSGDQPARNYAGPDLVSVHAGSKNLDAAKTFVRHVVFDRGAQELIGTTGAPVLTEYLKDPTRIAAEADLGPASYEYFVDQASDHGEGWAFVPKFADIGQLAADADFKIYDSPTSDVAAILAELNQQVQSALDSGTR